MAKDRLRHSRVDLPSYQFLVYQRPSSLQRRGNSQAYKDAIQQEAKKHIATPMLSNDIEIEICWATRIREGIRADIDNIIKPTLDALVGIAFDDDKRVRSVTSTLIDRRKDNTLAAYVEDLGALLYVDRDNGVQIAIYSDSRLSELGGEMVVRKKRKEEFDKILSEAVKRQMNTVVGDT